MERPTKMERTKGRGYPEKTAKNDNPFGKVGVSFQDFFLVLNILIEYSLHIFFYKEFIEPGT